MMCARFLHGYALHSLEEFAMKLKCILPAIGLVLASTNAYALHLQVTGIKDGDVMDERFAFCVKDGEGKTKNGSNINPQIRWSKPPAGTKSYALVVVDPDVPVSFDDANQEGKVIPANAPRRNFYHWVLVDIPKNVMTVAEGQASNRHAPEGKAVGKTSYGLNGQNDYAGFMKGTFGGYDGPCPPWNDARPHRYYFRVYALDTETLGLRGNFTGKQVEQLVDKHALAMAQLVGIYSNAQ
jgi:Raf kinase inhibitor-like YbhB/YbcL family protein